MKKIRSIYRIFILFLAVIFASLGLVYWYSSASLHQTLNQQMQIEMDYSSGQLVQKQKEFAIEADGILNSEDLRQLYLVVTEQYDPYIYITNARNVREYLSGRQASNVGMADFILYWPQKNRIFSVSGLSRVDEDILELAGDNVWIVVNGWVYFCRKYNSRWISSSDELYLYIRMEYDYLYKIKNMASGFAEGGSILIGGEGESLFSLTGKEAEILRLFLQEEGQEGNILEMKVQGETYRIAASEVMDGGLRLISYYPVRVMMQPARRLLWITVALAGILLAFAMLYLRLYARSILHTMDVLTENLKSVEKGDLETQIRENPNNEFSYVFEQFNHMVNRTRALIDSLLTEQELRSQAEFKQLQLQIQPHFLYNCLSYIVTVADQPDAVTKAAVHLSAYYRYSTRKKDITTIGEEIEYVKAYLEIMAMRKRIEYEIAVPEALYEKKIIPLVLQPIIENAIEHGIEGREDAKHIYVKIYEPMPGKLQFEVSDDGDGLAQEQIDALLERLAKAEREESESVGLWNVNRRLVNYYGAGAGLWFEKSIWRGLKVSFVIDEMTRVWRKTHEGTDCG